MTRVSLFSSPLLLGFEQVERLLDRATKTAGDGYPPYNIVRYPAENGGADHLGITLAVAGFGTESLEVTVEDNQLLITGRQTADTGGEYLHRGIAARQFARSFVLADGMEVVNAELKDGLLTVKVRRIEPERLVRRIEIKEIA
jgi:HSP20 family molecular chaperone IbpA